MMSEKSNKLRVLGPDGGGGAGGPTDGSDVGTKLEIVFLCRRSHFLSDGLETRTYEGWLV